MNKLQQIAERNAKQWFGQKAKDLTLARAGKYATIGKSVPAEDFRKYSLVEPEDIVEFPEKDSKRDDFEEISEYNKSLESYYKDLAKMYLGQARRREEQYDRELGPITPNN